MIGSFGGPAYGSATGRGAAGNAAGYGAAGDGAAEYAGRGAGCIDGVTAAFA
jgi:hypothetical protein